MVKHSWGKNLVLLFFGLMVLFSGFSIRSMLIHDFRLYLESQRESAVRVIAADIEGHHRKYSGWRGNVAAEDVLRGLQLGLELRMIDTRGEVVMDTEKALALLSPDRKKLVLAAGADRGSKSDNYRSYPLMMNGEQAGRLDVVFLKPQLADAFKGSGSFILILSLFSAGLTFVFGSILSRSTVTPASTPAREAASVATPEDAKREDSVRLDCQSEAALEKPDCVEAEEVEEISSKPEAEVIVTAYLQEEGSEDNEDHDKDDQDMQPVADGEDRIKKIVEGLEELEKVPAGSLLKQPIEVERFLDGIIDKIRQSACNKNIAFSMECDSALTISADPAHLTRIMENLLDNAAKAVKNTGAVTVMVSSKGDQVELAVRDTGTGIRRNHLPHIFEHFFRGSGSGIGLGLCIVKARLDVCGGKIAVQTERGKGSTFTLRMPAA